jgi:hypothetical protein
MTVDFTRTSAQLGREIDQEIENLQRQLMVSRGHGEKGASAVLNVLLVVFVLGAQFILSLFFERQDPVEVTNTAQVTHLVPRDRQLIESQLSRIEDQVDILEATKSRVAPSMLIDSNIAAIRAAAKDTRGILGLTASPARIATDSDGSE